MLAFASRAGRRIGLATALMLSVSTPALAQAQSADDARIAALEARVLALAAELAALKAERRPTTHAAPDAAPATAPATGRATAPATAQAAAPKPPSATAAISNGRPTIASADGRFSASVRGVVMLDAAGHFQDEAGPLATDLRRGGGAGENARARDLNDGTNFRRARLGVEGKVFGDFAYNMTYEFGGSGVEEAGRLYEASVTYTGRKPLQIRVGAFEPQAGLANASTSGMILLERASPAEIARNVAGGDSRVALQLLANGERGEEDGGSSLYWLAAGAVTGQTVGQAQAFDEQLGFTGRLAVAPHVGSDWLIHAGVNGGYAARPADLNGPDVLGARSPVQFRDRPELRVDGTRLVDTGLIDADSAHTAGVELAFLRGPLFVEGEYFRYGVDRGNGALADPRFSGWYVEGSWILTGETRKYNTGSATFDGPSPDKPFGPSGGEWGAFEIAARYSTIDLNFREGAAGAPPAADAVRGGEQQIWTLGLNWYLNPNIRLMLQGQHVEVDRLSPAAATFLTPVGAQIGQEYQTVALRGQFGF